MSEKKSAFNFGFEAFGNNVQCAAHDQAFMDTHIKGLQVGESNGLLDEWSQGFKQAQEEYLQANFPEMYSS